MLVGLLAPWLGGWLVDSSQWVVVLLVSCDWSLCSEPEPNQRQDNRSISQVGTRQVQTSQHNPREDLEAVGHRPRWNARRRRVRSRYASCQPQT